MGFGRHTGNYPLKCFEYVRIGLFYSQCHYYKVDNQEKDIYDKNRSRSKKYKKEKYDKKKRFHSKERTLGALYPTYDGIE